MMFFRAKRGWVVVAAAVGCMAAPMVASAQSAADRAAVSAPAAEQGQGDEQARAVVAQDILLLVTEEVDDGQDSPALTFWWKATGEPAWTETDEALREALTAHGVLTLHPEQANISRIYRTASLSHANAASLAGLLGARQALIGKVSYRKLHPLPTLGLTGVEVRAELHLVAAGDTEAGAVKRFTIDREVFGSSDAEAFDAARLAGAEALGRLVGRSLRRSVGPVGVRTTERLIGLRNAERQAVLESVKRVVEEIDVVDGVRERWAAEGIIALEINPGVEDAQDTVEYVVRVLENHPFESFRLVRHGRSTAEHLAEFTVEMVESAGY